MSRYDYGALGGDGRFYEVMDWQMPKNVRKRLQGHVKAEDFGHDALKQQRAHQVALQWFRDSRLMEALGLTPEERATIQTASPFSLDSEVNKNEVVVYRYRGIGQERESIPEAARLGSHR